MDILIFIILFILVLVLLSVFRNPAPRIIDDGWKLNMIADELSDVTKSSVMAKWHQSMGYHFHILGDVPPDVQKQVESLSILDGLEVTITYNSSDQIKEINVSR